MCEYMGLYEISFNAQIAAKPRQTFANLARQLRCYQWRMGRPATGERNLSRCGIASDPM